ncbi:TorF family putative porin [uncultured Marinobacter sp.]|uniref:TorF family putative porin n=1 Tax=uncultured Marinobacter sp. TaxID=187379 RepID=UPI0030D9424C
MKKNSSRLMAAIMSAGAIGAVAVPSVASAEVSAELSVVSNYLFRGVTQTNGATAVQGGLEYGNPSGFYAGVWASNVDFGDGTSVEFDPYLGFSGEAGGIGYDIGYAYYGYPDSPSAIDFGEIYGELSFGLFAAGLAYTVNSEADDGDLFVDGDMYYYGSLSLPLQGDYGLGFTVGYYDFDADGDAGVDASYVHYAASLSKDVGEFGELSFNFELADIDETDALGSDVSDKPRFWLGWSKSF